MYGLATWACEHQTEIRLLIRPGDYVFPGAPIALMLPLREGAAEAIRNATALAPNLTSSNDLRFAIRQLVEVAVRALSPGINDPHTAISVLNRLGAVLCEMQQIRLQSGVWVMQGRNVLVVPHVHYDELVDAMLHMIRQNAAGKPSVLIAILMVLTQVASVERDPPRLSSLRRHAGLAMQDGQRDIPSPDDLADLRRRYDDFIGVVEHGPLARFRH